MSYHFLQLTCMLHIFDKYNRWGILPLISYYHITRRYSTNLKQKYISYNPIDPFLVCLQCYRPFAQLLKFTTMSYKDYLIGKLFSFPKVRINFKKFEQHQTMFVVYHSQKCQRNKSFLVQNRFSHFLLATHFPISVCEHAHTYTDTRSNIPNRQTIVNIMLFSTGFDEIYNAFFLKKNNRLAKR